MAGNLSSGAKSTYDPGEGIRLFKGLHPDVALVQELNYGGNGAADVDAFVAEAFGAEYTYIREEGVQIPNAVVSRFPIEQSGRWADPKVDNRGFVYAKIAVPGAHPLWAVSVHLLTSGGAARDAEASALVAELEKVVAPGDYVVVGGDLNTENRSEPCLTTLAAVVETGGAPPVDQDGNDATNGPRTKPYDWVLPSPSLAAHEVPALVGSEAFPTGLVFDSRVYSPLADVAPVQKGDSAAVNMQHMPVVKDFRLP